MRLPAAIFLGIALAAGPGAGMAATVPAKNLGFEDWDARGRPQGWSLSRSATHSVRRDCAGARGDGCALRIDGNSDAAPGSFLPLAQPAGAGPAAGHRLKVSGWIRTANVLDGWAGLWVRADVQGKVVALENMNGEGPRGTTGWRRYEAAIDVPANATLVSFGVLLAGGGSAWFDDLALEIDTSVAVGRAVKPEVVIPSRPVPSRELVALDSLALPATQAPGVRPGWREGARGAAHPLRSLTSDDFSDLQFLRPLLAGKRVVQLGESAHGIAEFNWLKARLVRFLHREMGFDVVAFESSLSGCALADARIGKAAPVDVMRDAIFGVWHSTETLGLFEYLDAERAAGRRIALAGFDVQRSGAAAAEVSKGLVRQLLRVDGELARRIEAHEGRLRHGLDAQAVRSMKADYLEGAARLAQERRALRAVEAEPFAVDLAIQEMRSRARYVEQLGHPMGKQGAEVRDAGMADNLDFLLDVMFPGRKVIVWAHNAHIGRHPAGSAREGYMGSRVAERRRGEVYTIGLYMGWGIGAWNDRKLYEIKAAGEDSLEAVLAAGGWRLSFLDLSADSAGPWARKTLVAREWGVNPESLVPADVYDALIYVDAVTPPEYL